MRRTSLAFLWFGGLAVALAACGDDGGVPGAPPGAYVYGSGDDPHSSSCDPPTSTDEDPYSYTEGATCGVDERISLSFMALELSLPLCEFSESCSESIPDTPEPSPYSGPTKTLDMIGGFDSIPSYCMELAMSQSVHGQDTESCGMIEALGRVAKQYPACEQYTLLPRGMCASRLERCVKDVIAGGCAAYLSDKMPPSCKGIDSLGSEGEVDTTDPEQG